jgi:CDGSH-type Zn-finger protein/uncharacterized Fe-S cluster protein YjdI
MAERKSTYTGEKVEIVYDRAICIHAAECGRGSKDLFDASKDPWCEPDAVAAETAVDIVSRCPTGALTYTLIDKSVAVPPDPEGNTVQLNPNGPLYASGELQVNGEPVHERIALCRCGASKHKPYCDRSHGKIDFKDNGPVNADAKPGALEAGPLNFTLIPDGPIIAEGPMELRAASGRVAMRGKRAALCRCGASKNKPFCDGSHTEAGFKSEE